MGWRSSGRIAAAGEFQLVVPQEETLSTRMATCIDHLSTAITVWCLGSLLAASAVITRARHGNSRSVCYVYKAGIVIAGPSEQALLLHSGATSPELAIQICPMGMVLQ